MTRYNLLMIFLLTWHAGMTAYDFLDLVNDIKNAGENVGGEIASIAQGVVKELEKGANWAVNNKAIRSIDYGIRLAALESSKAVATAVLDASKFVADKALAGAYETAKLSVDVAEGFLREVVQRASTGVLIGPATAAKGILEGAKQATVGVLEGGKWITNQSLGQLDVTCIHYDGNIQDLVRLKLGNVVIKGKIIQPFTMPMDLDLTDPVGSVGSAAANIGKLMQSIFLSPFEKQVEQETKRPLSELLNTVQVGAQEAQRLEQQLQSLQEPEQLVQARKKLLDAQHAIEAKKKEVERAIFDARVVVQRTAALSYEDLLKEVSSGKLSQREMRTLQEELLQKKEALESAIQQR